MIGQGSLGQAFSGTVLSGPLLFAIPIAALAGFVSFLSPCILPLVPGYVGYVTGLTGVDLQQQRRGRMFAGVGLFILGFTAVFVSVGVLFSVAGLVLKPWLDPITRVLGVFVILAGIVFLGGFSWLQRERKVRSRPPAGLWGAPVLGVVFGLGWTPCIGPTFSAVQALAFSLSGDSGAITRGVVLTVAYCLGLGIPFLVVALLLRSGMGRMTFFKTHRRAVMQFGGVLLIIIGVLLVSGIWSSWMNSLQGVIGGFEPVI